MGLYALLILWFPPNRFFDEERLPAGVAEQEPEAEQGEAPPLPATLLPYSLLPLCPVPQSSCLRTPSCCLFVQVGDVMKQPVIHVTPSTAIKEVLEVRV